MQLKVYKKNLGKSVYLIHHLAESGIGGLAIGLSLTGFRPVMEIQFFGFVYEVMDSISGQLARMHFRTGGRYNAPVTIRSPFGGGVATPEMHADSFEGLMASTTRFESCYSIYSI